MTTRGFKVPEVEQLSNWIADVLDENGEESVIERVRGEVMALCRRFPVYGEHARVRVRPPSSSLHALPILRSFGD